MTDIVIDPRPSTQRHAAPSGNHQYEGICSYSDRLSDDDCSAAEVGTSSSNCSSTCSSLSIIFTTTLCNAAIGILIIDTTERGAGLWGGTLLGLSLVIIFLLTAMWWYNHAAAGEEGTVAHWYTTERSRKWSSVAQRISSIITTLQLIAAVVAISRKWMPRWAVATSLLVAVVSAVQLRSLMQLSRSQSWSNRVPPSSQLMQP